ncbi:MAG: hypothetical protein Q9195_005649 [Heterodermia aff. obscurata]
MSHLRHNQVLRDADPAICSSSPSPSILLVIPSVSAANECGQVGSAFAGVTTTVAPSVMSTIRSDHKTYSFNFDDLSCPPPDVGWNPANGPYRPQIAPGDFVFDLDPAFKNCTPGYLTGIDPHKTLKPGKQETPGGGGGHPHLGENILLAVKEDPSSSPNDPFQYFPDLSRA